MKKCRIKSVISALLVAVVLATGITGCSKNNTNESESVAETTGTGKTVVAEAGTEPQKIDPEEIVLTMNKDLKVPAYEVFYYLYSAKSYYEATGMITDWSKMVSEDMSLADTLKEVVEKQVLEANYYYSKAADYDIKLTEEDKVQIKENVKNVMEALDENGKELYGLTEANMTNFLERLVMSNKAYEKMEAEKLETMTDEEKETAKFRKVQHILISTMNNKAETESTDETVDSAAESVAESEYKAEQYKLAEEVLAKAKAGEDFEELAGKYTADSGVEYSINNAGQTIDGATMVSEFSEAAVALKEGEISDIVETQFGYHIIKCVTTNDEETSEKALASLAYQKIRTEFEEWLKEGNYEFGDTWTNYVFVNPVVETPETESEVEETKALEETESEKETK